MPTTAIYALRYPAPTDPADGPVGFQNLAEDVEGKLGGLPVTSLPGTPVDGQIIRYRVATNGPVWTLQYLATSSAPKWHFLGGAPLHSENIGNDLTLSAAGFNDLGTPASVTAPLAGDYLVSWGFRGHMTAVSGYAVMGIKRGAAATVAADAVLGQQVNASHNWTVSTSKLFSGLAAATILKAQFGTSAPVLTVNPTGGSASAPPYLTVVPLRVG